MNLSEMADFVCSKVRKTDSDSISKCKDYLKARDRMLWDAHLWRDSIYTFTKAIGPTMTQLIQNNDTTHEQDLCEAGIVLLPDLVDRVLGARISNAALTATRLESFFRTSTDEFARTGSPLEFAVMSPVAYQMPEGVLLGVKSNDTGDNATPVVVRWINETGGIEESTVNLATASTLIGSALQVEDVFKPATTAAVTFVRQGDDVTLFEMEATRTVAKKFQRLRLFPAATQDVTLRLLVKKKYLPLVSDYEEPRLRQAQNVLLAFARGDMLQRQWQGDDANEAFAEGQALLAKLGEIEWEQQADNMQLVPDTEPNPCDSLAGYGKGYFVP